MKIKIVLKNSKEILLEDARNIKQLHSDFITKTCVLVTSKNKSYIVMSNAVSYVTDDIEVKKPKGKDED